MKMISKEELSTWKESGPVAEPTQWGAPDCCRAHADAWGPLVEAVRALIAEVERLRVITTEQDAERRAIKKTLGLLGGGIGLTLSQEVERLHSEVERLRTLAWDLWADEAPVDAERVRALLGRA